MQIVYRKQKYSTSHVFQLLPGSTNIKLERHNKRRQTTREQRMLKRHNIKKQEHYYRVQDQNTQNMLLFNFNKREGDKRRYSDNKKNNKNNRNENTKNEK